MKVSFESCPEIIFIDGTYKLLMMPITVVLILVEDSNGSSEVAAVGLLSSEEKSSYKWFLQSFYNQNPEACKKIKCAMSDKDVKERGVVSEVFPGIALHICRFHTLQIFKRYIFEKNLGCPLREECLKLLEKLVYSHSEENYMLIYEQLRNTAPQEIMSYFDKNWHSIRVEWADYGMVDRNLGNLTNNRLESMNRQLKDVIKKQNSLIDFLKFFFTWSSRIALKMT